MRAKDFLTEVFDSPSYELTQQPTHPEAPFTRTFSGKTDQGKTITVYSQFDPRIDRSMSTLGIAFDVDGKLELTGEGDTLRILKTAFNTVSSEVNRLNPVFVVFLADKDHQKIYRVMARRLGGRYQQLDWNKTPAMFKFYHRGYDPRALFVMARERTEDDEVAYES